MTSPPATAAAAAATPLTAQQCANVVYSYFLYEGWLPPGTGDPAWRDVTMAQLGMDDPPLPSAPDLQKQRVALDLQDYFASLGSALASPLGQLKTPARTLGDFAAWCHEHQTA